MFFSNFSSFVILYVISTLGFFVQIHKNFREIAHLFLRFIGIFQNLLKLGWKISSNKGKNTDSALKVICSNSKKQPYLLKEFSEFQKKFPSKFFNITELSYLLNLLNGTWTWKISSWNTTFFRENSSLFARNDLQKSLFRFHKPSFFKTEFVFVYIFALSARTRKRTLQFKTKTNREKVQKRNFISWISVISWEDLTVKCEFLRNLEISGHGQR